MDHAGGLRDRGRRPGRGIPSGRGSSARGSSGHDIPSGRVGRGGPSSVRGPSCGPRSISGRSVRAIHDGGSCRGPEASAAGPRHGPAGGLRQPAAGRSGFGFGFSTSPAAGLSFQFGTRRLCGSRACEWSGGPPSTLLASGITESSKREMENGDTPNSGTHVRAGNRINTGMANAGQLPAQAGGPSPRKTRSPTRSLLENYRLSHNFLPSSAAKLGRKIRMSRRVKAPTTHRRQERASAPYH